MSCPKAQSPACQPASVRLRIVTPSPAPPDGEGWLHEIKHDGHRLVAIIDDGGRLRLISRNGHDRTEAFGAPFGRLAAGGHELIIDGEIAVPDDRGVAHLDFLNDAIAKREPHRLVYYAFDLLHVDGHDLRRCPIEQRKKVLRQMLDEARCERIIYVDHTVGQGRQLFEAVRQIGAEGIVSKRLGSLYRGGVSGDWLKAKCHETGTFVITGFQELGEGRLEALFVAESVTATSPMPARSRFGFARRGLWSKLDKLRAGPSRKGVVPIEPVLRAEIKFFGRHQGGLIRDGVLLTMADGNKSPARGGTETRQS